MTDTTAPDRGDDKPDPTSVPWRTGRKNPRNMYAVTGDDWADHPDIGKLDTPELAEEACRAHNERLATVTASDDQPRDWRTHLLECGHRATGQADAERLYCPACMALPGGGGGGGHSRKVIRAAEAVLSSIDVGDGPWCVSDPASGPETTTEAER